MRRLIYVLLPVVLCGCFRGHDEFVTLCNNHRELSKETNDTLVLTIREEVDTMRATGDLNGIDVLQDLVNRLNMLTDQSALIDEYVNTTFVDSDLVSKMIRNRWKGNK